MPMKVSDQRRLQEPSGFSHPARMMATTAIAPRNFLRVFVFIVCVMLKDYGFQVFLVLQGEDFGKGVPLRAGLADTLAAGSEATVGGGVHEPHPVGLLGLREGNLPGGDTSEAEGFDGPGLGGVRNQCFQFSCHCVEFENCRIFVLKNLFYFFFHINNNINLLFVFMKIFYIRYK